MTRNGFGGEERKDSSSCGFLLFEFGRGNTRKRATSRLEEIKPTISGEPQKKTFNPSGRRSRAQKPGIMCYQRVVVGRCVQLVQKKIAIDPLSRYPRPMAVHENPKRPVGPAP